MDKITRAADYHNVISIIESEHLMKTTPADTWFSKCVRERANWTCERCGKVYQFPAQGLDCAHYETRDNWAVRFDPINAFCLCRGCHGYFDRERRLEFEDLYLKVFGRETLDIWYEKCRQNATIGREYKRTRGLGECAKYYKHEFERMQELRSQGVTGRIEFAGWL
jgi:hypothetical protein